jgi:DNA-binding transcriptional regulator/RsmH inhibitor MraZ
VADLFGHHRYQLDEKGRIALLMMLVGSTTGACP